MKIIITIEDTERNTVAMNVEFDPPVRNQDDQVTGAGELAFIGLEAMRAATEAQNPDGWKQDNEGDDNG